VADYCWKGHLTTADQHRALFEAVNHRMWDITSGMTQWKINACEPSVQWQLFDWYLKPMVSYYYAKRACEPLHVQLAPGEPVVSVINTHLVPYKGMEVRARVYDLDSKLRSDQRERIDVEANTAREALTIAEPPEVKGIHFVRLDLHDAGGRELSRNFYWRAGKAAANFHALAGLPIVTLETSYKVAPAGPDSTAVRVAVRNPTEHLAILVQLAVTKGPGGAEVLPVLWDDNYFALLPGESRELTAMLASQDLGDAQPAMEAGGWNVQTAFECTSLTAGDGQAEVPAGRPLKIAATIARTFLDGSRAVLLVDGHPAESTFAWARGTDRAKVEFTVRPGPGRHTFAIAGKAVSVLVR
jgi:exo-1,4-beta-D-glucosaminidase